MDARLNTVDDPSTSDKNLVNLGAVTTELGAFVLGGLYAGLCHAFLVQIMSLCFSVYARLLLLVTKSAYIKGDAKIRAVGHYEF